MSDRRKILESLSRAYGPSEHRTRAMDDIDFLLDQLEKSEAKIVEFRQQNKALRELVIEMIEKGPMEIEEIEPGTVIGRISRDWIKRARAILAHEGEGK